MELKQLYMVSSYFITLPVIVWYWVKKNGVMDSIRHSKGTFRYEKISPSVDVAVFLLTSIMIWCASFITLPIFIILLLFATVVRGITRKL